MQKKHSFKTVRALFAVLIFTLSFIGTIAVSGCCMPEKTVNKTIKNPAKSQAALVNTWQLIDRSDGKPITLTVTENGTFYGSGGVNTYNGKLKASFKNGNFEFDGAVAATMKYGHGIQREGKFFQLLNKADSWQVNNAGQLELYCQGKVIAKFIARPAADNE